MTDNNQEPDTGSSARGNILEAFFAEIEDVPGCVRCRGGEHYAAPIRMAFQPIVDVTEREQVRDPVHTMAIVRDYQKRGFLTAIDDFGAGFSGLNLLAQFQPHIVKLDMALTRDIDSDRVRRAIVEGVVGTCRALECQVVAEGVETMAEAEALRGMGITLFQGYLFARPQVEALPEPDHAVMAALAGR